MNMLHALLPVSCGGLVGFTLGLIGGGGSILATPLLLYVVGLSPHQAIGTGALAVSINAFVNCVGHARIGNVRWRPALLFAGFGVLGAAAGSTLGKAVDGRKLLFLFAVLMVVVGLLMLRKRRLGEGVTGGGGSAGVAAAALAVGALSGFFGIGGGFLIVPGLLVSTGMPMLFAIGSSLFSVGAFGLTTAVNYALSGLIVWQVAAEYILGGVLGGYLGMALAVRLAPRRALLNRLFAGVVFVVAGYMMLREGL